MNKQELIAKIAEMNDITKKEAGEMLEKVITAIEDGIIESGKLSLYGFGNFEVKERAARKGRNPSTGETMEIPATKALTFKPAKALKDRVKA